MINWIKKNDFMKYFAIIFISVNLLIYIFIIQDNLYGSDFVNYEQGADSLLKYFIYSTHGDGLVPDNFRPIGYSLVIAVAKIITPSYYDYLIIALQSILFIIMYLYVLETLKILNLYNSKTIFISMILFMHPVLLSTATQITSDLILSFFIFIFIFYMIKFILKPDLKFLIIGIICLSLSLHMKPTFMYFIPILLIIIYKYSNIKNVLLSIAIITLLLSPWIIRNKIVLDTYKISRLDSINLAYFAADTLRHSLKIDILTAQSIVWKQCNLTDEYYYNNKNDNDMHIKIVKESVKIIFDNIEYFIVSWVRGVVRVFLMPHEIYELKNNITVPVNYFINTLKSNPKEILSKINGYFIYLYVIAYILNALILVSFFKIIYQAKKYYKTSSYLYYFLLPLLIYGILIPGPINKPRYMVPYYIILAIFTIFSFSKKIKHK